jgi:hypothetical protein
LAVNGFLFWRVAKHLPEPPWGLIHLNLADETFGITTLPDSVDPARPKAFALDELHGELCVTDFSDDETVTIWTLAVQEDGRVQEGQCWERRCVVQLVGFFPSVGVSSRWTNHGVVGFPHQHLRHGYRRADNRVSDGSLEIRRPQGTNVEESLRLRRPSVYGKSRSDHCVAAVMRFRRFLGAVRLIGCELILAECEQ